MQYQSRSPLGRVALHWWGDVGVDLAGDRGAAVVQALAHDREGFSKWPGPFPPPLRSARHQIQLLRRPCQRVLKYSVNSYNILLLR